MQSGGLLHSPREARRHDLVKWASYAGTANSLGVEAINAFAVHREAHMNHALHSHCVRGNGA